MIDEENEPNEKTEFSKKDIAVLKQILSLEKYNNRTKKYTNSEMVKKLTDIIIEGAENEI